MHDIGGGVGAGEYGVAQWLEMECACEYFEGVGDMMFVAAYIGESQFTSDDCIEPVNDLKQGGRSCEERVYKHCK